MQDIRELEWLETFELRVPEIDGDHHVMLDLMKGVRTAAEAGEQERCEELVDRLIAFSRDHFRREESFIERHGYAGVHQHTEYHKGLLGRAQAVGKSCREIETPDNFRECCDELMSFLIDDVVRGDLLLKSFLKEAGLVIPE